MLFGKYFNEMFISIRNTKSYQFIILTINSFPKASLHQQGNKKHMKKITFFSHGLKDLVT